MAGFAAGKWSQPVPADVVSRLRAFWEWREAQPAATQLAASAEELAEFGWWFASRIFDDDWCIEHLLEVLKRARKIDPAFAVMSRLTEIAPERPLGAIRCLQALVRSTDDIEGLFLQEKEVETIVRAALRDRDGNAPEATSDVLERLGRHFLQLRELVRGT